MIVLNYSKKEVSHKKKQNCNKDISLELDNFYNFCMLYFLLLKSILKYFMSSILHLQFLNTV